MRNGKVSILEEFSDLFGYGHGSGVPSFGSIGFLLSVNLDSFIS